MPRPGKTKITSFPPQTPATLPIIPQALATLPVSSTAGLPAGANIRPQIQPTSTPLPGALSTLPPMPLPLEIQPQNVGLPPELIADEPITFPPDMTIDELIELRRVIGKNDPKYWAAFDEIQKKRDYMYKIHHNSLMKALQDLTIAMYVVNKKKVPETVGKPFEGD